MNLNVTWMFKFTFNFLDPSEKLLTFDKNPIII